jgi:uncharacterized protein
MNSPDFERARQYALERLERELPASLTYHSLAHTRDDVVPAAERLAALEGIDGEDLLLLRTAAYYHDLGFVEQPADHEAAAVRIVSEVLPRLGYSPAQIDVISGIILVTRIPHEPRTHLQEIMADADLDVFGRDDFWPLNRALRAELAGLGQPVTDEEWYAGQLAFLQAHRYFTAGARTLRQELKQRHIEELAALLEECQRETMVKMET